MENNPLDLARVHILVKGRVQGVGFRSFVQGSAALHHLSGWVRNVGYDTVEIVAEDSRPALEKFTEAVRNGPRAARVDETTIEWGTGTGEFDGFGVKYGI